MDNVTAVVDPDSSPTFIHDLRPRGDRIRGWGRHSSDGLSVSELLDPEFWKGHPVSTCSRDRDHGSRKQVKFWLVRLGHISYY